LSSISPQYQARHKEFELGSPGTPSKDAIATLSRAGWGSQGVLAKLTAAFPLKETNPSPQLQNWQRTMTQPTRGRYTHGHEPSALASHSARTAANSAAYLLPHLRPGMQLIDIGCGPGPITLDLAALLAPGKVIGLEKVEAPLVAARAEAAARGDTTTVFLTGDALSLPFDDATFDVVHAHQVLQHLTDPVTALREMMRVCKP